MVIEHFFMKLLDWTPLKGKIHEVRKNALPNILKELVLKVKITMVSGILLSYMVIKLRPKSKWFYNMTNKVWIYFQHYLLNAFFSEL